MKIFYWKYLLAFLLANSILSIPLKSYERDKNGIVNLKVKNLGISIKMLLFDFRSKALKRLKMFVLIP
jgi:hypothetical protein